MSIQKDDDENAPDHIALVNPSHITLVKLEMENITYQPLTEGYASSNRKLSFKKKNDSESKPLLRKTILNNVTPPPIEPYKLQAWMGPSGSGKTSLLAIAAGMTEYNSETFGDESRLTLNDDPHNFLGTSTRSGKNEFPKGLVGVVWQDDLLLSNLTGEFIG